MQDTAALYGVAEVTLYRAVRERYTGPMLASLACSRSPRWSATAR